MVIAYVERECCDSAQSHSIRDLLEAAPSNNVCSITCTQWFPTQLTAATSSRVLTPSAFKRRFNSSLSSGESFMSLSRHSRIAHHLKTPLTLEQICGIVEKIVQFWPRILTEATSNHSLLRFYCQRQLHECRTSTWLLEQTKKKVQYCRYS